MAKPKNSNSAKLWTFENLRKLRRWKNKTPRNWGDVTLKQFIELRDLPETNNKITRTIQRLAVLTGLSEDEVRDMQPATLSRLIKRIDFIDKLPKESKRVSFYHGPALKFWKWKYYKREKLDYTTAHQVTEILQLNNKEENVGRKILNVLAVIYYTGKDTEYNADRYEKTRAELESLDFATALNSATFFLTGLKRYFPDALARYFQKMTARDREKLTHLVGNIENLNDLKELKILTNGTTL